MKSVSLQTWHESYQAALLETDKQKLPSRIDEAEKALMRGRELFAIRNDPEAEAVDDALYALRALRNCLKMRTREPEVA